LHMQLTQHLWRPSTFCAILCARWLLLQGYDIYKEIVLCCDV
jgi:hypothetical protein